MFTQLPIWLQAVNTLALGIGYVVIMATIYYCTRPILRGLSYGLFQMVLLIKIGAPLRMILKALAFALFREPIAWFGKNSTVNISDNYSTWSGIFQWHYSKKLHRGLYKLWIAEKDNIEAARQKAMDDDV